MFAPTGMQPIRVGIADDHPIVRRALRYLLQDHHDMCVAGEASSGREAIDLVRGQPIDVLLLDLEMPDQSGFDALRTIKAITQLESLAVLIWSESPENHYALRLMRQGASGYLHKSCSAQQLLEAIRRVASGRRYISNAVADLLVSEVVAPGSTGAHARLSMREMQMLVKLARGRRATDVAAELSLSPKTVSAYRAGLMRKLNARSVGELAYYALKYQLVD